MAAITSSFIGHAVASPGQQHDQIQNFGLSESQMNRFGGILRTMNLAAIPMFASNVCQFGHKNTGIISSKASCDADWIPCKIGGLPLCGSFNIVFTIEFDDGFQWMLKVSANGHRFDSVAAAALISEARTMQLLKHKTTIPVPAVYAFDASSYNDLNTPFILMERIDGKPLYRGWFNDEIPKARLEHFRVKALQSLAEAMAQLNKFTLNRGGALEFDTAGRPVGLRGAKVVDAVAMYYRGIGYEDESEGVQGSADNHDHHDYHDNDEYQHTDNKDEVDGKDEKNKKDDNDEINNEDDEDLICEKGPFEIPKSAFLLDLDRSDAYRQGGAYTHGCYKALRMFIDLAFSNSGDHGRGFVLTHPDLDVQNILVAEDGSLRGLIDWDGVASVPREVGCAQYPLWLMRDWVPYYYLYDIREGKTEDDAGYEESSPAELASYRALYAHFMEKEIERQTGGPDQVTTFGTLPKQEAQFTRRSLVMRDLDLAASSPFLTTNILCHIVNQIEKVTEPEWGEMGLEVDSDSSCSSGDDVESDSDTNGDTNSSSDQEDPETEATEADGDGSSRFAATASIYQVDEGVAMLERVVPQAMAEITDSSSEVPLRDHGSQSSSKACQPEADESNMEQSTTTDLKADVASSTHLGWAPRLLCFGCNTAEKTLRRLARVGHVDVAEVAVEVETQHQNNTEHSMEGEPGQAIDTLGHRRLSGTEASGVTEPELPEDIHSTQIPAEPEQPQDIPLVHATVALQGTMSTQDTVGQDQPDGVTSIQPTIRLQDIPARKVELVKAEKARKKAQHCADKAAIKEELVLWEHIAFMVSSRGVSLEQLQVNQGKIASLIVDTLQAEEKHEDDLVADPYLPPAAESVGQCDVQSKEGSESSAAIPFTSQPQSSLCYARNSRTSKPISVRKGKNKLVAAKGDKISPGLGNKEPSSGLPAHTTLGNIPFTGNQLEVPSTGDGLAGELVLGRDIMVLDDEAVGAAAKVIPTPSSRSQFTLEGQLRPKKASGSLEALCAFGTSCLKKIFSNRNKSEDGKGSLTPASSVKATDDSDSDGSDTGESCKSSATSLSDGGVEFGEDTKAKEDKDEVFGTVVFAVAGKLDDEGDRNGDNDAWEVLGKDGAVEKTSPHNDPTFAGGLGTENDSDQHCEDGIDAKSEEDAEDEAGDHDGNSSRGGRDAEEDVSAFRDDGDFRSRNIFTLLGMNMLDELRLLRMQEGFFKLLEQY